MRKAWAVVLILLGYALADAAAVPGPPVQRYLLGAAGIVFIGVGSYWLWRWRGVVIAVLIWLAIAGALTCLVRPANV